jgi:hypothetical protein
MWTGTQPQQEHKTEIQKSEVDTGWGVAQAVEHLPREWEALN